MKTIRSLPACVLALACVVSLSGCGKDEITPNTIDDRTDSGTETHHGVPREKIDNASYVLLTPAVRYRLTEAGENFTVHLKNGSFEFRHPSAVAPYEGVRVLPEPRAFGDLTGDGKEEAVVILRIGSGDDSRSEVAALAESGGVVRHVASYVLGHAEVSALSVTRGQIHATAKHVLPGDPSPRTTEFVFSVK